MYWDLAWQMSRGGTNWRDLYSLKAENLSENQLLDRILTGTMLQETG